MALKATIPTPLAEKMKIPMPAYVAAFLNLPPESLAMNPAETMKTGQAMAKSHQYLLMISKQTKKKSVIKYNIVSSIFALQVK